MTRTTNVLMFALSLVFLLASKSSMADEVSYNCVPVNVFYNADHVSVECSLTSAKRGATYPTDDGRRIKYFAVPTQTGSTLTKRFDRMANLAVTGGLVFAVTYESGDASGVSFGCNYNDCRRAIAFTLMKTAFVELP